MIVSEGPMPPACDIYFLPHFRYPCFNPGGKICEEGHHAHYASDQLSPACSGIAGIVCEA